MTLQTIVEAVGYFGSLLIIISMLMTSVVKLRIINSIGSAVFAGYALCIHSYPTAAMQFCLIIINCMGLYRLLRTKNVYSVVKLEPGEAFLSYFLHTYGEDIVRYFPGIPAAGQYDCAYLVCCGYSHAGVLLGTMEGDSLTVKIDYTISRYRDTSVGTFLYAWLSAAGVRRLIAETSCPAHVAYLKKMGFVQQEGKFIKQL